MKKRILFASIKVIGVGIFLFILSRLDLATLMGYLRHANLSLLVAACLFMVFSYFVKSIRWHAIVRSGGAIATLGDSWRLFNIGIFLSIVTPGHMGELGRAAYLKKANMHTATALAIVVLDRFLDVITIGIIGIAAVGLLFGVRWFGAAAVLAAISALAALFLWKHSRALRRSLPWLDFLKTLCHPPYLSAALLATVVYWPLYFCWPVLVAYALGISVSLPILVSALALTGIVALLPISPSGLGTRDAALALLLAPAGVAAPQAVALGFLMFLFIVLSSVPGMYYWLRS